MRKLVWFTLPFAAACLLSVYVLRSASWMLLIGCGLALLPLLAGLLPQTIRSRGRVLSLGLACGFLYCGLYGAILTEPVLRRTPESCPIEAECLSYPSQSRYGWLVDARTHLEGRTVRVRLYLPQTAGEIEPGDTISGQVRFFSREDQAHDDLIQRSRGCLLSGSISKPQITPGNRTAFRFWPQRASRAVRRALVRAVPEDCAGFLCALITGDKSLMSYAVKNDLSVAGASHTVAISGMHVTILIGVLGLLFGRRSRATACIGIVLVLFFVLFTGASQSVIRAAVMISLLLAAPLLRRQSDTPTSLAAALLLSLVRDPYAIAGAGLQLSYGAVAGLLLFAQPLSVRFHDANWVCAITGWPKHDDEPKEQKKARLALEKQPLRRAFNRVFDWVLSSVAATLSALSFTAPLIYLIFKRIGFYTILTNLLVLPVVTFCFVLGFVTGIVGLLLPWLGTVFGAVLAWPVRYLLWVCAGVSRLPFASIPAGPFAAAFLILLYLGLIVWHRLGFRKPLAALCALVLLLAACLGGIKLCNRVDHYTLTALDVGQGQCLILRTKARTVVVDCGGSYPQEAGALAAEYLGLDLRSRVDCLILTHYDEDHAGGVTQLLHQLAVDTLYLPDVPDESGTRAAIERAAAAQGSRIVPVSQDYLLPLDGAEIRVFAPVSSKNANAACLTVLFSAEKYDMLITGDMDEKTEQTLLQTHDLPDVEVYVAGHHGSAKASSEALLAQICPETVLISVGEGNRYGHPAQETLDRFADVGAQIYRTDQDGTIEIRR